MESYTSLDREDGSYVRRNKVGDLIFMEMGKCERTAFTGFPALKF